MKKYITILALLFLSSCLKNKSEKELITLYQQASTNGQWNKALDCVNEGLNRRPNDTSLFYSKALCLKNINTQLHHKEIDRYLSAYLKKDKTSVRGLILKYTNYYDNQKYALAVREIERLERFYGISPKTLALKANAEFLNRDFKNAALHYEEVLYYPHDSSDFKQLYYYKIYAKYFGGNQEGAIWDTAFLENYGFDPDEQLLDDITNNALNYENYNQIPFVIDLNEFEQSLAFTTGIAYGNLYDPAFITQLYRTPNHLETSLNHLSSDIEYLDLSYSNLSTLPKDIGRFKNLRALNLSRNPIKDFDPVFEQLAQLEKLEFLVLNYTNLKNFPASIGKLTQLKGLAVEAANIRTLPREIGLLKQLSYLSVRNNGRIKDLPKEIKLLKNLNVLDVSGSGMQRLRPEIALCYNLIALKANASKIVSIPEHIGLLKHLRFLNLGYNRITTLPESIGELFYLDHLSLGSNELTDLPNTLQHNENLHHISLDHNRFKTFPKQVLSIPNLNSLWIHNNNITSIPIAVTKMKKLVQLLVDHEIITDENIANIKKRKPKLYVVREDCLKYVKGKRRKD